MSSLLVAMVVSLTAVAVVAVGIAFSYGSILALLHAVAPYSRPPKRRLLLVISGNRASGD